METKICSKCQIEKSLTDFHKKRNGYCSHCIECQRIYVNDHYQRHKDTYKATAKKNSKIYIERYNEYKKSLSCTDCGLSFNDEPYLCDFHHTDSLSKDINVGLMNRHSFKKFLIEVDKCVPLCANCHRRRHNKQD